MGSIARATALLCVLIILAACPASGPTLRLDRLDPGESINGNVVRVSLDVGGMKIADPDEDNSGNTGHFAVFIDRKPVGPGKAIPEDPDIIRTAENPIVVSGLRTGKHSIAVVLEDGNRRRIGESVVEATLQVKGPTLNVVAPTAVAAGEEVLLHVMTDGVTIAPAGESTPKGSGHFHVFVDRDSTPAGQPIPKEEGIIHSAETPIRLSGLAAGRHMVWVVLGDSNHVAFKPLVAHRVVFTIK